MENCWGDKWPWLGGVAEELIGDAQEEEDARKRWMQKLYDNGYKSAVYIKGYHPSYSGSRLYALEAMVEITRDQFDDPTFRKFHLLAFGNKKD
jgi:hypothetical protein